LRKALDRDSDDGLCWYYLGASQLRLGNPHEALRCGYRAARCPATVSTGYDLAGRAAMRLGDRTGALAAFEKAVRANGDDAAALDHLMVALFGAGQEDAGHALAARRLSENPTALLPQAFRALGNERAVALQAVAQFARHARGFVGEDDFELLDSSLVCAELGLFDVAAEIVQATCVDAVPPSDRSFLPLYYLAWYTAQRGPGHAEAARRWLAQAAAAKAERVFASRPEELEILRYAAKENPGDAQAHLQLGCLLANLGRVEEALPAWQKAAELNPKLSIAWRNLGLAAAARSDLAAAEQHYRKALAARPSDQTLHRDLAEILIAAERRPDAIRVLETMPLEGVRRADITVMLAEAYVAESRWEDCLKLLEATPYFVNWEGQDVTWRLFNRAHIERGRQRLEKGDAKGALADFEAALTYPANLNVGRSHKPEEAPAQYWRGRALAALGRAAEARTAWQTGAAGADVPGAQNEYRQKCREAL
jgi:tetratricopeptide (TPR) repeat protein